MGVVEIRPQTVEVSPDAQILVSDLRLSLRTEESTNNLMESAARSIPAEEKLREMTHGDLVELVLQLAMGLDAAVALGQMALADRYRYMAAIVRGVRSIVRDVA